MFETAQNATLEQRRPCPLAWVMSCWRRREGLSGAEPTWMHQRGQRCPIDQTPCGTLLRVNNVRCREPCNLTCKRQSNFKNERTHCQSCHLFVDRFRWACIMFRLEKVKGKVLQKSNCMVKNWTQRNKLFLWFHQAIRILGTPVCLEMTLCHKTCLEAKYPM